MRLCNAVWQCTVITLRIFYNIKYLFDRSACYCFSFINLEYLDEFSGILIYTLKLLPLERSEILITNTTSHVYAY